MFYSNGCSNNFADSLMPTNERAKRGKNERSQVCKSSPINCQAERRNNSTTDDLTPGCPPPCNRNRDNSNSTRRFSARNAKSPILTFHLFIIISCLTISVAMSEKCGLSQLMCQCISDGWGYKTCAQQYYKKRSGAALPEPEDYQQAHKQTLENALKEENMLRKRHVDMTTQLFAHDFDHTPSELRSKRALLKKLNPKFRK